MARWDLDTLAQAVTREVLGHLSAADSRPALQDASPGDPVDPRRRPLVAGNWKMNACKGDLPAYLAALATSPSEGVDMLILPPAVLLHPLQAALREANLHRVTLGAQALHWEASGAHTGELSAGLLLEAGARFALVGHSERRQAGETDAIVRRQLGAGLKAGLSVMLCVGERLEERRQGATWRVLRQQVQAALSDPSLMAPDPHRLAVAYEPVWAIGTGERAEPAQVNEAAAFIRRLLAERWDFHRAKRMRILYGGSVTPESAAEILSLDEVDGVLVGGASLKGRSFGAIVEAATRVAASRVATSTRKGMSP